MPSPARPTLAAIAVEAGVSPPTVSKVLNGRFDVADRTRAKVEAVLVRHGYAPRRRERAELLDLVVHDVASQWADALVRGTVETAADLGYGVVVSTSRSRRASGDWLEQTLRRGTDGLIAVVSPLRPHDRERLARSCVPAVLLDPLGGPVEGMMSVGVTNWQGGLIATEHLTGLGHRRIAVIGGPAEFWSTRARVDGYRAALANAGIAPDDRLIRFGNFGEGAGYEHAAALLDLADPPTAIFCGNDEQAIGAHKAVRDRGCTVPDDVSLVGFDDIPLAGWLTPALTTVRQPLEAMAAQAVQLLVGGERVASQRLELSTELVVRDSTAPPRAG